MARIVTFTEEEAKKYHKTKEHKENIEKLNAMTDEDIDYTDIPEIDDNFFKNAKVVYPAKKDKISIRIDHDILEYFKTKGKGYQSMINSVLRSYYEAHKQ